MLARATLWSNGLVKLAAFTIKLASEVGALVPITILLVKRAVSMIYTLGKTECIVCANASTSRKSVLVRPALITVTPVGVRWLRTVWKNSCVVSWKGTYGC